MMRDYEMKIWSAAVNDAESDLMRVLPTLIGGKKVGESVESYANRCQKEAKNALAKLAYARKKLSELSKVKK